MMRSRVATTVVPLCMLLAAGSGADTFIETFDGGSNTGGWTYFAPQEVIETSGGNPGAYLHASGMDTFAPQLSTAWGMDSVFTGDWRARNVTSIGTDLILHHVDFSAGGRPLSPILVHDNFTPTNFDDDYGAYYLGDENIPLVGEGWKSYDFEIPSQADELPDGWGFVAFGPDAPEQPQWVDIVSHVSQVRFFYGDPTGFFIFQMWEVGADNLRITDGVETRASIRSFAVVFGSHLGGGVSELEQSDDLRLRAQSQFGFKASEPNLMEIRVHFETANPSASALDVAIESRINQPEGTARIRLRNWASGLFVQVDQHAIGSVETTRTITGINAGPYIRQSDGRIVLSIRHSVFATFSATGFTSSIDLTAIDALP